MARKPPLSELGELIAHRARKSQVLSALKKTSEWEGASSKERERLEKAKVDELTQYRMSKGQHATLKEPDACEPVDDCIIDDSEDSDDEIL